MNLLALKKLVGLVPRSAWVALAIALAVLWYGSSRYDAGEEAGAARQLAADQVTIKALADRVHAMAAANERAAALDAAAHLEQARKQAQAEATLKQEKADALAKKDALIADLRAGTQRLRLEWQGCRSAGRGGADADSGAEGEDAAAELRAKGAGDLVGNADAADADIRYLQSLILAADRCFKIGN